ncbi:MAG: hypothetical protein P8J27_11135 [Mariniblastus sp.]|nr:hypothetical protein [Mariniblastus sp.]
MSNSKSTLALLCAAFAFVVSHDSVSLAQTDSHQRRAQGSISEVELIQSYSRQESRPIAASHASNSTPVSPKISSRRTAISRQAVTKVAQAPPMVSSERRVFYVKPEIHSVEKAVPPQIVTPQNPTDYRYASAPVAPHFNPIKAKPAPPLVPKKVAKREARKIQPNLDQLRFVDVSQFLPRAPRLDDPKKYLPPPIVTQEQERQSEVVNGAQPRKLPAPRAQQEKVVPPVQGSTDQLLMNSVSDVGLAISPIPLGGIRQNDPSQLLVNDPVYQPTVSGEQINYAQLTQNEFVPSSKSWLAPNFVHRPLYFEDAQLERYGNRTRFQLVRSGLHFFATIPVLPYRMGADAPWECQYTYGNDRPGDCVPYDVYRRPLDKKGLISQAFWTSLIVLP